MKKALVILGILVAIVALVGGGTIVYAQGKGNSGTQDNPPCDQWLIGTVIGKAGNAESGNITLLPRGESETVNIAVNSATEYKGWLAPNQKVTFNDIAYGDWIVVCIEDSVARVVVMLEAPFYLSLEGNVTAVNGSVVTVHTDDGNFTIDLSGVNVDLNGAEGQPVKLTIGRPEPLLGKYLPGLQLGWLLGKGHVGVSPPGLRDLQGKLERFRQRFEEKSEKWQHRFGN